MTDKTHRPHEYIIVITVDRENVFPNAAERPAVYSSGWLNRRYVGRLQIYPSPLWVCFLQQTFHILKSFLFCHKYAGGWLVSAVGSKALCGRHIVVFPLLFFLFFLLFSFLCWQCRSDWRNVIKMCHSPCDYDVNLEVELVCCQRPWEHPLLPVLSPRVSREALQSIAASLSVNCFLRVKWAWTSVVRASWKKKHTHKNTYTCTDCSFTERLGLSTALSNRGARLEPFSVSVVRQSAECWRSNVLTDDWLTECRTGKTT